MYLSITMVSKCFNEYDFRKNKLQKKRKNYFSKFYNCETEQSNSQKNKVGKITSLEPLLFSFGLPTREHLCIPKPLIRKAMLYVFMRRYDYLSRGNKKKYNGSYKSNMPSNVRYIIS